MKKMGSWSVNRPRKKNKSYRSSADRYLVFISLVTFLRPEVIALPLFKSARTAPKPPPPVLFDPTLDFTGEAAAARGGATAARGGAPANFGAAATFGAEEIDPKGA